MKNFFYIAEINLPSTSAYALHVLKMCDAFANLKYDVKLIIFYKDNKLDFNSIKKKYNLKNNFKVQTLFKKRKKYNFFDRCKLALYANNKINLKALIVSRSIISSLYLAFKKKKNNLEIHHNLKGVTSVLFKFRKLLIKKDLLNYILINKSLVAELLVIKKEYIVLDDAVDLRDFDSINSKSVNECVYTGSFLKGKGLEIITKLAKLNPKIIFNIYGDKKKIDNKNFDFSKTQNIILNNHLDYSKIPKVLKRNKILLMPYQNKVYGLGKDLEIGKFMSPMKMFDYLASGNLIIASNLKVYSHILKNNFNAFLVKSNDISQWNKTLQEVFYLNNQYYKIMKKNMRTTIEKYTWIKRAHKIINFDKNN
tara:strand:+ start:1429 stop:2526 length:1098 start_codon:yes stop_codon:yes gene_type:complete